MDLQSQSQVNPVIEPGHAVTEPNKLHECVPA